VILSSVVWIGYQRVTDGRMDGATDSRRDGIAVGNIALCVATCKQCGRAVKIDQEMRKLCRK